jgi:hypothetical protein
MDYDDNEIGLAERTKNMKTVVCPWVKKEVLAERYDLDVSKTDTIFDLLMKEKHLRPPPNHVLPSPEELKKKWCKWHNSPSHHTNECRVFKQHTQSTIQQGHIMFDDLKKLMKIDGHPFPVSMIEGSTALINKYKKKREREDRTNHEIEFDPHWECPFFKYCWD